MIRPEGPLTELDIKKRREFQRRFRYTSKEDESRNV